MAVKPSDGRTSVVMRLPVSAANGRSGIVVPLQLVVLGRPELMAFGQNTADGTERE